MLVFDSAVTICGVACVSEDTSIFMQQSHTKQPYQSPTLEPHPWQVITGVSLPIGTLGLPENPLEAFEEQGN
jgi:hypothetical protein